jgi:hypothetical protein
MSEIVSEIAYFRKQQALSEEAVQLGLNGYAEVARHERIIARMEQGPKPALKLLDEGRLEEAVAMMECDAWGMENPKEAGSYGQTLAGD